MDYKVIDWKLDTVPMTADPRVAGHEFARLTLESEDGQVRYECPVFDKEAEPFIKNVKEGKEVPENNLKWMYCRDDERYEFPEPMYRIDQTTKLPVRSKWGALVIADSVRVFTRYKYDPFLANLKDKNGNPISPYQPMRGWSVEERGRSIMYSFYIPVSQFGQQQFAAAPAPEGALTPEQAVAAGMTEPAQPGAPVAAA